ncbi:MAG: hypothetical protein N2C14_19945, partial [Planctomycetales bacterium]
MSNPKSQLHRHRQGNGEMADEFDPYHKWLGIPREDQPPHHYRLLGIPPFVDDMDVIGNAADRQMQHLRSFGSGAHVQESQRLLNEISTARVCLLNEEKKAAYDAELRRALQASASASASPPQAPPRRSAKPPKAAKAVPFAPAVASSPSRRRKSDSMPLIVVGVVGGLLLTTLAGAFFLWPSDDPETVAAAEEPSDGSPEDGSPENGSSDDDASEKGGEGESTPDSPP